MLGARLLVVLLAVAALGPAAGATSVQAGWDLVGPTNVVFVGDYVNLTLTGPAVNYTGEFRLYDPNNTLTKFFFDNAPDNGTWGWNFSTASDWFPQNGSGTWRVEALINGNQVAYAEFGVLFDELTFLSRRQALLEERVQLQDGIVANLVADNHVLHDQLGLIMIFVPAWIVIGGAVFWWTVRYVTFPWYKLLVEIRQKFDHAPVNLIERFIVWAAAPWGGSEQEQFHVRLRLLPEPLWPSRAMADRVVKWKAKYDVAPRLPVKKLRVVVRRRRKEGAQ